MPKDAELCGNVRNCAGKCGPHNFPEQRKKCAVEFWRISGGEMCRNYAENAGKYGKMRENAIMREYAVLCGKMRTA